MTDNEIIKAYEGLTSNQQLNLFRNFYYNNGFSTEKGIIANAINDILPKYCKQQEEIEQLKFEIAKLLPKGCPYAIQVEVSNNIEAQIKSEAIKEFAVRLKCGVPQETGVIRCSDVDNLVKEMIGEQ